MYLTYIRAVERAQPVSLRPGLQYVKCTRDNFAGSEIGRPLVARKVRAMEGAHQNSASPPLTPYLTPVLSLPPSSQSGEPHANEYHQNRQRFAGRVGPCGP